MDESSSTIEPVHLDNEERELYLVKLPAKLGEAWNAVNESDLRLGSIRVSEPDENGRRVGELFVNSSTIPQKLPQKYRVNFEQSDLKLKVFSQDGSGRMAVEGIVQESGRVMPMMDQEYKDLCRKRLLDAMITDRNTKQLESLPKPKRNQQQLTIDKITEDYDEDVDSKSYERTDKKFKMEKGDLKNLVFHLFEQREFWPLKELNMHCHQPEAFLKEILKEICVYHRKGSNKSCYELKPQYKNVSNGTQGE